MIHLSETRINILFCFQLAGSVIDNNGYQCCMYAPEDIHHTFDPYHRPDTQTDQQYEVDVLLQNWQLPCYNNWDRLSSQCLRTGLFQLAGIVVTVLVMPCGGILLFYLLDELELLPVSPGT